MSSLLQCYAYTDCNSNRIEESVYDNFRTWLKQACGEEGTDSGAASSSNRSVSPDNTSGTLDDKPFPEPSAGTTCVYDLATSYDTVTNTTGLTSRDLLPGIDLAGKKGTRWELLKVRTTLLHTTFR